ncbi:SpoIIE family protein phosphatase [Acetatifactor aquisgranensis]|uniref:SpoIIE family protein phosphatase n=1 Tax=Acetatifactor aquisgranensis TaxID=2941233 RepID=UPI00203ECC63|nr:SpoIIE family protein phosphatase [Acetatifactor aquisgranensis]MCI8542666.1 SpoIIE family protein phosphatase [Lachnospiraceae bacterium]
MMRRKREEKELQTAQVSDLCRRRLLSYADSFHELARSYDREFVPESGGREAVLTQRRLWESRQIISGHLDEMAKIMTEAACEVLSFSPMEGKKKRLLTQALAEEGIQVEAPHYLPREDGRQAVVLTMSTRRGSRISVEDAADMISVLLDRRLAPAAGSPYVVETDPQSFVLEEETGFLALTGFAKATKEDETVSGDNYAVVDAGKGRVTVMLSDGTGSGERAGRDSEQVLDLMEKMLEAGYDIDAAINMVNTALFAAGEDVNHPTLDICDIDLYGGSCQLRKVGGAATFLKRNQEVEQVAMGNLPLGIFGQMEVLPVERKLQDGDYLIMVSDGVVDAFGAEYENTMSSVIAGIQDHSPGEIAEHLLRLALCASGGKIRDDMTIGVIGVWEA